MLNQAVNMILFLEHSYNVHVSSNIALSYLPYNAFTVKLFTFSQTLFLFSYTYTF